jgi:hypothetical protein
LAMENTERKAVACDADRQARSRRVRSSPACRHGWQPGCGAQQAEYVPFTLLEIAPGLGAAAPLIVKWTRILGQDKGIESCDPDGPQASEEEGYARKARISLLG